MPGVVVFPVVTAAVVAVLAFAVWQQWRTRRRPYQLAWTLSLVWGLLGTLGYIGSVAAGDNAALFRLYYLGGAVLVAPLLGVGSAYLLPRPLWARLLLAITVVCGVLAVVGLVAFPLDRAQLAQLASGAGDTAVTSPLVIVPVIVGNSLGAVAVFGVALWSIVRALVARRGTGFVVGNVLIAAGTLGNATAGTLARLGHQAEFWGLMTLGWVLLYAGFAVMAEAAAPAAQPGARPVAPLPIPHP